MPQIQTKLPRVGVTIFTKMSALANQHSAINLSQGFPNFQPDPRLVELAQQALADGHHQYAPMTGLPKLRDGIVQMVKDKYDYTFDPKDRLTVTVGASEGLFSTISALIHPGDEVIIFDPSYDVYQPAVELAGGVPKIVKLQPPGFGIDWAAVEQAVTSKTRMIVVNTPHNPTGSILSAEDLSRLARFANDLDLLVLSDEVYQHIVYDGRTHHSVLRHPDLRDRAIMVGSFGKSLHITGWKLGYVIAPPAITTEMRKVHQYNTFTSGTPLQHAIANYIEEQPDYYAGIAARYQEKLDHFRERMTATPFEPLPTQGSYYQLYKYDRIQPEMSDTDFAIWLIETHGVAVIPISVFYRDGTDNRIVRFCFAKTQDTLDQAIDRLCKISV